MRPELSHPREERAELFPIVPVNLLGEQMTPRSQYPCYFSGVELLMPVEDKIESLMGEREGEAVRMYHIRTERLQPLRSNRYVGQPWLRGDSQDFVSLQDFGEDLSASSADIDHGSGVDQQFPRSGLIVPGQRRAET